MKTKTIHMMGVIALVAILALFSIVLPSTVSGQATTVVGNYTFGTNSYPIISSQADLRPIFQEMIKKSDTREGVIVEYNGAQYAIVDNDPFFFNHPLEVYRITGSNMQKFDCGGEWYVLESYEFVNITWLENHPQEVTFAQIAEVHCDQFDDPEGGVTDVAAFIPFFSSGKTSVSTITVPAATTTSGTTSGTSSLTSAPNYLTTISLDRTHKVPITSLYQTSGFPSLISLSSGIYSEKDDAPLSANPFYVFFQESGSTRYVLQIWKFKSDDEYSIGLKLLGNENGELKKNWANAQMKKSGSSTILQTKSVDDVFTYDSDDSEVLSFRFIPNEPSYGSVEILLNIAAATIDDSGDQILRVAFDGSQDTANTDFRFGLNTDTLAVIRSLPEYTGKTATEIMQKVSYKVLDGFGDPAGTAVSASSTGTPDFIHQEGLLKGVTDSQYWQRRDIKSGTYQLAFTLEGYEEVSVSLPVTKQYLLPNTPTVSSTLSANQVYRVTVPASLFKKDFCTSCDSLLSCLACMDNRIINSYEK